MKKVVVVKIGGNIIDHEKDLIKFLKVFSKIKGPKLLVHGGGKLATQLCTKLDIETKMIEGRRVTDADTLKVATMVYAGWINKFISAQLNALGCVSIGLSGADVNLIPSEKRKVKQVDYGFVGDVSADKINSDFLSGLLKQGICPVISPITATKKGQLLNTNADTIASVLALALSEKYKTKLMYCFEKKGVMQGDKVITELTAAKYKDLKKEKIITDGMIPKLDNAFTCLEGGVKEVVIAHAANLSHKNTSHVGTRIVKTKR